MSSVELSVDSVNVVKQRDKLNVTLEGIDIREIVEQIGTVDLLNEIGLSVCVDHFDKRDILEELGVE